METHSGRNWVHEKDGWLVRWLVKNSAYPMAIHSGPNLVLSMVIDSVIPMVLLWVPVWVPASVHVLVLLLDFESDQAD